MTGKPTIADAALVFERSLSDFGWTAEELTADTALQVFGMFAAERFATGSQPDADGLAYQYGVYALTGKDMFHLELTRQFEKVDDAGEYDGLVQFRCALLYPPDPELHALGRHDQWWFPDGDDGPLSDWLRAIERRPEWSLLRARRPSLVDIASEDV